MMNLFTRKQKESDTAPGLSRRIAEAIDKQQHRISDYLNERMARLSLKTRKLVLLTFGLLTCAVCIGLVVQAYHGTSATLQGISKPAIVQPALPIEPLLTEEDFRF